LLAYVNEEMTMQDVQTIDEIPPQPRPHTCPWYVQYLLLNPLRRLIERPRQLLAPHVQPGMVVAEPGCGFGAFSLDLARLVGSTGRVLCVDIEPRAVAKLERRARRRGLDERIEAAACTPDDLGLAAWNGRVDLVALLHVLHEAPDQMGMLRQAHALLRRGGRLLLTEPPGSHLSDAGWDDELARCRAAGFEQLTLPAGSRRRCALFARDGAA
jgi:SAM-dependent methyltransferase